jgi:hypothetical protein
MVAALGAQNIQARRLALTVETVGARSTTPAIYIIPFGKITPVSTKANTKHRATGNRDPVLSLRMPETFKISIPMAAILEDNGLGHLMALAQGPDTPAQVGATTAYDHPFVANDTCRTLTLWLYDTINTQSVNLGTVDGMKMEIDRDKNEVTFTFDLLATAMQDDTNYGSASYINMATQKPNVIPASQTIMELGQPQSWVSNTWSKLTVSLKNNVKYGAPGKAPVPVGSSNPRLVVWGDRDVDIELDFIDLDKEEMKRFRQGGDIAPTATAHADIQALTKFRVRSFGSICGSAAAIWGYAHQANAGTVTATMAGTYSGGATVAATYEVYITTASSQDKFKWRKNGGTWSAEVSTAITPVTLSEGVTVTFSAVTGSALNDTWYIFSHPQRMIEFTSPTNVIEDENAVDSSDFYKAKIKMFHESGVGGTKASWTIRNTTSSAYMT